MTPGTEPTVLLRGEPKELDAVWRPPARAAAIGLGLIFGAGIAWFGEWLWAPVPLALLVLLYELVFQLRADRPVRVTLTGPLVRIEDARLGTTRELSLADARAASLGVVRSGGPLDDVLLSVYGDREVLLAVELAVPTALVPEQAVDLRALRDTLGGRPSLVRGLAPPDRLVRQTLRDRRGAGLKALLACLPSDAFERCAVRVWRGKEPETDFMGQLRGSPDGVLCVSREGWTLRTGDAEQAGEITAPWWGRASRTLELVDPADPTPRIAELPLHVWRLHRAVTLAFPAPVAGLRGKERRLSDDTLHVHLAEAAMLVGWAWRVLPKTSLPEPLRLSDAPD